MKRAIFVIVFVVSVFTIKNLVQSIYDLWQKQDLLVQANLRLEKEKKRHEELRRKLAVVESEHFIEEQARNKLFLGREGESEVILPPPAETSVASAAAEKKPNYQQWLDLFF